MLVTQLCPTLCNSTNCSPPGSFVHGILQARTLEWVVISFSRDAQNNHEHNKHQHQERWAEGRQETSAVSVLRVNMVGGSYGCFVFIFSLWASLVAQMVNNLPAMQETWVRSLSWENPLEKRMATNSSILAWRVPWTEEPCRLQSMGSQRCGRNPATEHTHPLK